MRNTLIFIITILMAVSLSAKKKGAPPMAAGAPNDRTCNTSKCHAGNDLNTDKAIITIEGLPEAYTPSEIYEITLKLKQDGAKVWGFQATVADEDGHGQGTLMPGTSKDIQLLDNARYQSKTDRQYLTHTQSGIKGPKKGISPTWTFQWQAPDSASSSSSFYFAFNAADGNTKKTGDFIYTRSIEVEAVKK
ncbi:MAG: hypothetical protein K9M55_01285 [Candidatus Marinimicrobia bacterium]|nr:hypothetical protein [Candidatus Neomarinimicrobiota bacterium]MCF7921310.1 hypothetical protein [Candidatus Neomarinimicrobiota bacterium]